MESKTYGIVGNGNLASHLLHYFQLHKLTVHHWHRGLTKTPEKVLETCDVLLILISDDEIEPWIEKNPWIEKKIVIHCSGSLVTEKAQGFHPLFNFTSKTYGDDVYPKIPFVVEKGRYSFRTLFPELPNPHFEIPSKDRALYHALCVMAGNFPTMIWQKTSELFEKKLKLPPNFFLPYLQNCVDEFASDPKNALTGPFVRRDKKTIKKNLKALKKTDLHTIYKQFAKQFAKGRLAKKSEKHKKSKSKTKAK